MMIRAQYLARRLSEVLLEGKWVAGTNFKEEIMHTDWKDATRSVDGLNSIAALTFHILYYLRGVSQVLRGGPLTIKDRYSFDAPAIRSQQEWDELTLQFCAEAQAFVNILAQLPDEQLAQTFVKDDYGTYQRNIDLMIEHTYYHLGQIVLIRKLLESRQAITNRTA